MTWVAWRQYRLELIIGLALLAALAAFLVPTGIQKLALFRDSGLAACLNAGTEDCSTLARRLVDSYRTLNGVENAIAFAPAILGVLLAAPIVMEFEQRTYRLAWTQSITRGHWLAVKLGLALLGAVVFSVVMTALLTWWYAPLDRVQDPFAQSFNFGGVVPIAYTLFALAVALAVGTLSRRTIPAMLVALVLFLPARLWVQDGLRPSFAAPVEQTISVGVPPIEFGDSLPGRACVVGGSMIDGAGNPDTDMQIDEMCGGAGKNNVMSCLESNGIVYRVLFHPANRFWRFQAIEAAFFLGAAVPLLGLTVWIVRRRIR